MMSPKIGIFPTVFSTATFKGELRRFKTTSEKAMNLSQTVLITSNVIILSSRKEFQSDEDKEDGNHDVQNVL